MNEVIADVNRIGRMAVIPTSVAGAGVTFSATTGLVTLSAATTANINGCFTNVYGSYKIEYRLATSASTGLDVLLRDSGVNAITNYDNQRFTNISATLAGVRSAAGTAFQIDTISLIGVHAGTARLVDPFVAVQTLLFTDYLAFDATFTVASGEGRTNGRHRNNNAYDGFNMSPPSGNITGTMKIYGLT